MKNMAWFTNLDTTKRHETPYSVQAVHPGGVPAYNNYDAIEVARYADIPMRLRRSHGRPDHLPRQVQP